MSGDNNSYTRRSSPQGALTFMVLLSYAAMLFNSGAAITSFILVDSLSELPYTNATLHEEPYPRGSRVFESPSFLLRRYGVGIKWNIALWHCKYICRRTSTLMSWIWSAGLFCYFAGIWCLILQIVTYVIMQEPDVVRVPVACVAVFIILPLFMYTIPRSVMRTFTSEHTSNSSTGTESQRSSLDSTSTLTDGLGKELETESVWLLSSNI